MSRKPERRQAPVYRELTVAHVRRREDAEYVEVLFLESARIYKLPMKQPASDELLQRLRTAEREGRRVRVGLAALDSNVIRDVQLS